MQVQSPGKLPDSVTKPMAWNAFDHVFHETDWRLRIRSLAPLSFDVQHDGDFSACLSDCLTWQGKRRARSWIAGRILELASAYDKTLVRSLSLQIPEVSDGPVAEALLTYLERRLRNTILDELVAHFDTSIPEWERSIQIEIAQLDDPDARWHATRYAGLDQLVSTDAARKAVRFVMHRMHWYLDEENGLTVLRPDWRFEHVRAQRSTLHEETRARTDLGFDRVNALWFIVALLRLKLALPIQMVVLADRPIQGISDSTETSNLIPVELQLQQLLTAPPQGASLSDFDWCAAHLTAGAALMKDPIFNRAFQTLDGAIHTSSPGAGIVVAWAAIETLLRPGGSQITKRLCSALAAYLHPAGPERDRAYTDISRCYEARGGAVHAGAVPEAEEFHFAFSIARRTLLKAIEQGTLPVIATLLEQWRTKA